VQHAGFGIRITAADRAAWQERADARAQAAFDRGQHLLRAGRLADAVIWLERAHRIAPTVANVSFTLALAHMACGQAQAALATMQNLMQAHDFSEGWTLLASAALSTGKHETARIGLHAALSRFALTDSTASVATRMADHIAGAHTGWCGLRVEGDTAFVQSDSNVGLSLRLDGRMLRPVWRNGQAALPKSWLSAERLEILITEGPHAGEAPIGAPIDLRAITRCTGFVQHTADGVRGWAWYPAAPHRTPVITMLTADGTTRRLPLDHFSIDVNSDDPLSRPRLIDLPGMALAPGETRFLTPAGTDLAGSPLVHAPPLPRHARRTAPPRRIPKRAGCCIVIPVFGQRGLTIACLDSVIRAGDQAEIIVVDDGTPDPALSADLRRLARKGSITLLHHTRNRGFPAAVNTGFAAARGRDVVILNSDTLVPAGWLADLADIAYAAPDHGTVTPLSNDATILSYPDRKGANPSPDAARTNAMAALTRAHCHGMAVEIPTAVGFCTFLRHDCLLQTGNFRSDLFAQGYAEENDFCMRAAALGWRHVGAPGIFVAHVGSASFGAARPALLARNLEILRDIHPHYDQLVESHIDADPLAPARRRLDLARWRTMRAPNAAAPCVLAITHAAGGGVERVRSARSADHRRAGRRTLTLRPTTEGCAIETDDTPEIFPNLRFSLPDETETLAAFLRDDGVNSIEWHHMLGHHPCVRDLPARLGVPYDVFVHDYVWFCPRITLVGPEGTYCGEPDLKGCTACIAKQGSLLGERIGVRALQARSRQELTNARRVSAPSADCATRTERHFPGLSVEIEAPEDDRPDLSLSQIAAFGQQPDRLRARKPGVARVCVPGAIGMEKGFDLLLRTARHARIHALPLEFAVVGHTIDDDLLMETGHAFVLGEYTENEAEFLIRMQDADIGFIPSLWPETWCLTLSLLWRSGLRAAALDLGAPAARITATGRGWVLPAQYGPDELANALIRLSSSGLRLRNVR